MRIMLTGLAKLASELPARKSRHTNDRHQNIQTPPSIFCIAKGNFTLAGLSPVLAAWAHAATLKKEARSSEYVTILYRRAHVGVTVQIDFALKLTFGANCPQLPTPPGAVFLSKAQGVNSLRRRLESFSICFSLSIRSFGSMPFPTLSMPE